MMKKITMPKLLFILLCIPGFLMAQEKQAQVDTKCFTDSYNAELLETNPKMMGSEFFKQQIATKIEEIKNSPQRRVVITIPLVVHVLHNGEAIGTGANISDAQVISQVTVMNEDFRMMMGTPGESTEGGVDVEVEFVLAQRTPEGCPTNGINRVNICQDGTNQSDVQFWKTQTYWDPSKYMNMWSSKYVGDLAGILGYAQFPGGPGATDGVSAGHTYFGSSDYDDGTFNTSPPYDKGRTMTHEVGHYLGLYHTFQGGCTAPGDEVADTPAVASPNFNCPPNNISCGTRDMVENYMDYTDDTCMNTFTQGQKDRVQAVLASAPNRSTLGASDGATPVAAVTTDAELFVDCVGISSVPCSSDLTASLKLVNWGTATLTSATVSYNIDGNGSTDYNWTGSLAYGESDIIVLPSITPSGGVQLFNAAITNANGAADERSCNDTDFKYFESSSSGSVSTSEVRLHLVPDDYGSETTWTFSDENGTLYSGGPYTNNNTDPIDEVFTLSTTGCYTFTINDSFGDGICCAWGDGSYELRTDDDTVIFSGGEFGDSESISINVSSLSVDDFTLSNTISLYPNPTQTVLNIKVTDNNLPESYTIHNMLGQTIVSKQINSNADLSIDSSTLSNGMYFIKISNNNASISLPFIKK